MTAVCLFETRGKSAEECACRKCALRIKMRARRYKPSGKKMIEELQLDRELDRIFERERNK